MESFQFKYIESGKQAEVELDEMLNDSWLAVDMEFYSRSSYYPQLCLLQVATETKCVVIDTLADNILQNSIQIILGKLAQHPCLVFHSGRQDWSIFMQLSQQVPRHVFDIQYAGIFLGLQEQPSLEHLSEKILNQKKISTEQCSDWRKRPLRQKQIDYARHDVELIAQCYQYLITNFKSEKIQAIQEDSEDSLLKVNKGSSYNQLNNRMFGYSRLSKIKKYILQELVQWREVSAQHINIPASWLVDNNQLNQLIKLPNKQINEFIVKILSKRKLQGDKFNQIRATLDGMADLTSEELDAKLSVISISPIKVNLTTQKQKQLLQVQDEVKVLCNKSNLTIEQVIGKKGMIKYIESPDKSSLTRGWRYYYVGAKLKVI